ncbi:uncharacterized protein LOC128347860 [Hemicordylus capensis]|uniref:uncharacterized protein LOC128347860 n=1 Tax=Hemicordylus capensis TaxID=884348 RepID=UPI002303E7CD|nr:uncharacterized protein LOC128347860 [Hemicordylus capensis]XP_053159037.1 uncharacterized protein LOC128347860 [Hemicordylus capensis]
MGEKMRKDLFARLRRVCNCCRKLLKTSPTIDSTEGKPPRGRFWRRKNRIEPTPVPPPTPAGGSPAVSGVTIGLTIVEEEVDSAEVIFSWTQFLSAVIEDVKEAKSLGFMLSYDKDEAVEAVLEIMEDIREHPDPGFLLRFTMDTVTELTTMKPPMQFNIKAAVLNVAVSGLNQLDPGTQENMASFKNMLRGLLEEAPSVYNTIGILKELHKYIDSEEPRLQALGREAYGYALAHVIRLPNLELATHKDFSSTEDELTHHLIKSTIKDDLVLEDFNEEEEW